MTQLMNENEVLKKLDIADFRHLTKDKIIQFASNISEMDPAVAMKAIEQFPEFSKSMTEIVGNYINQAKDAIKSSEDSQKQIFENDKIVLQSLNSLLAKGDSLSFEEKKFIISEMETICEREAYKDTENKNFLLKLAGIAGTVVLGVGGVAVTLLTNGKFSIINKK